MTTHKPYYKTGTGQVTMDGKIVKGSGELLGYAIFEVVPKDDSQGMMTFFVTRMIEQPMPLEQADEYLMKYTRGA